MGRNLPKFQMPIWNILYQFTGHNFPSAVNIHAVCNCEKKNLTLLILKSHSDICDTSLFVTFLWTIFLKTYNYLTRVNHHQNKHNTCISNILWIIKADLQGTVWSTTAESYLMTIKHDRKETFNKNSSAHADRMPITCRPVINAVSCNDCQLTTNDSTVATCLICVSLVLQPFLSSL